MSYFYFLVLYATILILAQSLGDICLPKEHVPLFVFGDSAFDAGNNNYINTTIDLQVNFWPYGESFFKYPTGRASNGRLIPDFIAEYANLPPIPPYLHPGYSRYIDGVNFASAGSGALVETRRGLVIDLHTQLSYFKNIKTMLRQEIGEKEAKALLVKAVYLLSVGINDYAVPFITNSSVLQSHSQEEYVNMVIGNLTTVIKEMSFLKSLWGDLKIQFSVLMLYLPASFSEIFTYTAYRQLCQMFLAIIFFHSSEYIIAIFIHGTSNVTLKSLLISKNYLAAMIFSLLEYFIEIVLFPGLKEHWWVSNLGLAMVIVGEIIRKTAIITAGQSFTHHIRISQEEHHKLITHGIYRCVRHPGYCGFFIWSVGTQIMLCNPISTIAFAIVVWRFFAQRIPYEEYFLGQFFGPQFEEYALRVTSGVPFINFMLAGNSEAGFLGLEWSDNLVDFQSVSIPGVSSPKSLSQMASILLWGHLDFELFTFNCALLKDDWKQVIKLCVSAYRQLNR
ncbi:protein-S-isoprenylcysteine O-methyltransferase A isoform X1 [Fagus crenata]